MARQSPSPFAYLVTDDTARLGRNSEAVLKSLMDLLDTGVEVHFVAAGLNSADEEFQRMLKVFSFMDGGYQACLRARVLVASKGIS